MSRRQQLLLQVVWGHKQFNCWHTANSSRVCVCVCVCVCVHEYVSRFVFGCSMHHVCSSFPCVCTPFCKCSLLLVLYCTSESVCANVCWCLCVSRLNVSLCSLSWHQSECVWSRTFANNGALHWTWSLLSTHTHTHTHFERPLGEGGWGFVGECVCVSRGRGSWYVVEIVHEDIKLHVLGVLTCLRYCFYLCEHRFHIFHTLRVTFWD